MQFSWLFRPTSFCVPKILLTSLIANIFNLRLYVTVTENVSY
jgi:hypothetical protein